METIYLNYKDIHFLLGDCTVAEAKHIVRRILVKDRAINKDEAIRISHAVDSDRIDILIKSPFEQMNGQKKIPYIINQMRSVGISDTMKHALLEDITNVVRGGHIWKVGGLKKDPAAKRYKYIGRFASKQEGVISGMQDKQST